MNSIHLVLALASSQGWVVHRMDVKSAFLYGDIQEEIYIEKPHDYVQGDSNLIFRLNLFMDLNRLFELNLQKWIAFFLRSTSLDVILTLLSTPRK